MPVQLVERLEDVHEGGIRLVQPLHHLEVEQHMRDVGRDVEREGLDVEGAYPQFV